MKLTTEVIMGYSVLLYILSPFIVILNMLLMALIANSWLKKDSYKSIITKIIEINCISISLGYFISDVIRLGTGFILGHYMVINLNDPIYMALTGRTMHYPFFMWNFYLDGILNVLPSIILTFPIAIIVEKRLLKNNKDRAFLHAVAVARNASYVFFACLIFFINLIYSIMFFGLGWLITFIWLIKYILVKDNNLKEV